MKVNNHLLLQIANYFFFFFKLAQLNKNSKQAQVILFFAKSMPGKHTIPTASF
jgi:hypothetical protein